MPTNAHPIINSYLADELMVGEPDVVGPLAVFPIVGPKPRLEYLPFATARERGFAIKELQEGASVNDLLVENPTDTAVLLFEGEEVLGAQQNRTFDVTVLVPAHAKLRVPVSCVEAGQWDYSRHDEDLKPAPQTAYPELRRVKNLHVRERVAAGLEARADQRAVWHEIDQKSRRHGARSRTGAMHDVYESRRERLHELTKAIGLCDGQSGSLVAIGGCFTILDFVSRPDAFAGLHGPLAQGYALDALEAPHADPPPIEDARGFVALVTGTQSVERDSIGLGRELRFAHDGVAGSGLVASEELIHLTAFPEDGPRAGGRAGDTRAARIRRPSSRRS